MRNLLKLIQKKKEKHAQGFETFTKKKFNKIFVWSFLDFDDIFSRKKRSYNRSRSQSDLDLEDHLFWSSDLELEVQFFCWCDIEVNHSWWSCSSPQLHPHRIIRIIVFEMVSCFKHRSGLAASGFVLD